ncbi:MAG: ParA family protein [Bacteroidota bacterium]
MSARIISIAHRKGGVGKTTVTLHLATCLAVEKKMKVLVLDTDSQQSAKEFRQHEQQFVYEGAEPPYRIEFAQPKYLFDDIKHNYEQYDVIFIDVPRLTETAGESQLTTALNYCDSLLIPIVAGELEALSTKDYIRLVEELAKNKKAKGFDFTYYGFLNKKDQRRENTEALDFMEQLNVPMFESSLARVKALSVPYTYESILQTKEGKKRFGPFFKEFIKKFEL